MTTTKPARRTAAVSPDMFYRHARLGADLLTSIIDVTDVVTGPHGESILVAQISPKLLARLELWGAEITDLEPETVEDNHDTEDVTWCQEWPHET